MNRLRAVLLTGTVVAGLALGNLVPVHNTPATAGLDSELGSSVEAHPAAPLAGLKPECAGHPNPWRFMFLGDSQSTGFNGNPPYWSFLWNRMGTVPKVSVGSQTSQWGTHEAVGGIRPGQVLAKWNGLLNNYHPDVVLMDLGTNLDWVGNYPDGPTTLNSLRSIIDQALAFNPCMRFLMAKPSLRYDNFEGIAQQWLNDRIPSLAESFDTTGTQVRWMDFSKLSAEVTVDGLHSNARGADLKSCIAYDQVQHFVGWGSPGSPGDGHLAPTRCPWGQMAPAETGTSIKP